MILSLKNYINKKVLYKFSLFKHNKQKNVIFKIEHIAVYLI